MFKCLLKGVPTDDFLRTSNPAIYAVGDCANPNGLNLGHSFTHLAGAHAGIVVENAIFGGAARASELVVPWTTFHYSLSFFVFYILSTLSLPSWWMVIR